MNDLKGRKFGMLLVSRHLGRCEKGVAWLEAICDCGEIKRFRVSSMKNGLTNSCGCAALKALSERNEIKKSDTIKKTKEYLTWRNMVDRCTKPHLQVWPRYGGRGITVCDRWLFSFENFLEDMGEKPEGMSLDRINNEGNYQADNCRWATPSEQSRNQRSNRNFTIQGETKTLAEWVRDSGAIMSQVRKKLEQGKSIKIALCGHKS